MCCFYEAKTIRLNKKNLAKEPTESIDVDLIRKSHAGESCPICNGLGYLRCAACEDGFVPFLGGCQECSRCRGAGLKACLVCESSGSIKASLPSPKKTSSQIDKTFR